METGSPLPVQVLRHPRPVTGFLMVQIFTFMAHITVALQLLSQVEIMSVDLQEGIIQLWMLLFLVSLRHYTHHCVLPHANT